MSGACIAVCDCIDMHDDDDDNYYVFFLSVRKQKALHYLFTRMYLCLNKNKYCKVRYVIAF